MLRNKVASILFFQCLLSNYTFNYAIHLIMLLHDTESEIQFLVHGIVDEFVRSSDLLDRLSKAYGFRYSCFWQPNLFLEELTPEIIKVTPWLADKNLTACFRNCYSLMVQQKSLRFFDITKAVTGNEEMSYIEFVTYQNRGMSWFQNKLYKVFVKDFFNVTKSTFK